MGHKQIHRLAAILFLSIMMGVSMTMAATRPIIIDHSCATLDQIPETWIKKAKKDLVIAYGHTSHGSQLITGMAGLVKFKGDLYSFNENGQNGALKIHDRAFSNQRHDLGHKGDLKWAQQTRTYLDDPAHHDVNVVIWSWCGGCSDNTKEGIDIYLNAMAKLETDYPAVKFVYMTGHLDGTGLTGNLHQRNEQIREFCKKHGKILYDFEDIESYDPDGRYFGDKFPTDNCDYRDGDKHGNWAKEWQDAHTEGKDWYPCQAAHSQPLNGNRKAYAAWWLFARLAGWPGVSGNGGSALTQDDLKTLLTKAAAQEASGDKLGAYVTYRRAVNASETMTDIDAALLKTIKTVKMKTLRNLEKDPVVAVEKKAYRKLDRALESTERSLKAVADAYPDSPSGRKAAELLKTLRE